MKKIMKVAFVAAFAAIAGYGVYTNRKVETMSDLMQVNLEALAGGEDSEGKGTLYGTEPDENGKCYYCCCPGDNDCGAVACSGC